MRRKLSARVFRSVGLLVVAGALPPFAGPAFGAQSGSRPTALRIVVIEGEDAINVIQQKSAVAPIVEVRDRNDQPVGGAVVTFAIRSGRATFSGARTLTVTTNAAGRAAVAGLTPTGPGALQISASAAFQGQTAAAVTIAQTNVMTAEAAAASAGASGSGAGAGGTGAGSGGGLSATTATAVAGAAAGGTLVAVKALQEEPAPRNFSGTLSGSLNLTFTGCTRTHQQTGTLALTITVKDDVVTGTAILRNVYTVTAVTCTGGPQLGVVETVPFDGNSVTGAPGNIRAEFVGMGNVPVPGGVQATTRRYVFTGALNGDVITGTVAETFNLVSPIDSGTGSASYPVTLR